MMRLLHIIPVGALLLWSITVSAGTPIYVQTATDSLKIVVEVVLEPQPFAEGKKALFGKVAISNRSGQVVSFGNKCLKLSLGTGTSSRTYKDTIASAMIDFASVQLRPGETLTEKAYWVFSLLPQASTMTLSYESTECNG